MSLHDQIVTDINDVIEQQGGIDIISPASVALILHARYGGAEAEPHIAYASLEHLKQMARTRLARRFDKASDPAELDQGELFANALQQRYPVPTPKGQDAVYKATDALTYDELMWNAARLEKAGKTLLEHSRALKAKAKAKGMGPTPANDTASETKAA